MAASMGATSSTLFVRNLPFSATKEHLEEVFGEVGPVIKSFVVTEKGVKEKCRGFGYVTFALREDADKATKAKLVLAKRKLYVSYARRKEPKKRKKANRNEVDEEKETEDDNGSRMAPTAEERRTTDDRVKPHKQKGTSNSTGEGRMDAGHGKSKFKKERTKEEDVAAEEKKGRLIIRNLAFQCSEKRLKKAFAPFGDITEVHIPSDPTNPGKVRGYGFIQFRNVASAAKAVKEMNAKEIMGRPIAVDWSLPRNQFLAAAEKDLSGRSQQKAKDEEDNESGSEEGDESDEESGVESSSEVEEANDDDNDDDEEEDSDDEEDDEEEEEEEEDEDEDSSDEEDNQEDSSSEDEGVASTEEGKQKQTDKNFQSEHKAAKVKKISNDVGEGRTVFIRNILFETTEEEIRELFTQFGEIKYSKLVVDRATEHSKGTAFVQFATKEEAERCLQKASSSDESGEGLVLGGRQLLVSLALPREEASKLREIKKEKQKALKKDKRNMYLLQEGFIRPGTSAAKGMSESDLAKRTKLESIKRVKLKNINIFISPTRLAIHNLPKAVDDKKLREALLTAAGDKKAKVIESRVMRDMKTPNAQGQGKSLGFAFAEFTKHEHALAALRKMNNSTEFFGDSKRPIVGFSLENRLALEAKKRRQERSLMKSRQIQSMQKSKKDKSKVGDDKEPASKAKPKPSKQKKGVIPPPPSSKLEQRMQSKSKMTVHVGAKKRWRDRGKVEEEEKKKRRERRKKLLAESGRKQREPAKPKGKQGGEAGVQKSRKHKKDSVEEAKFDKLVAAYKHKLFQREDSGPALKRSKWFEEG